MRRTYIDWLRGVAVLIMIEWHAVDAWTLEAERSSPAFLWLAWIGGWAAPLFLFLAGVAIPLAADAQQRKGRSLVEASRALQRRGWQVFVLAHVFRLQSYLLNPYGVWHSIFKPDILNILGLGMVAVAFCCGRGGGARGRGAWLGLGGLATLVLTPYSRSWEWPALWLHPRLEAYLRPNGGFGQFPLFPWLVFMFAGAIVGLWMAQSRQPASERRFHVHLAAAGAALVAAGWLGRWLPTPLPTSGVTEWNFLITRIGLMTLMLVAAWAWLQRPATTRSSPIVLFGQTSLFVYWVHVELAYGLFSAAIKRSFTIGESLVAYVVFTALMWWLASWWKRRTASPWIAEHLVAQRSGT